jgi:hypothetical protein
VRAAFGSKMTIYNHFGSKEAPLIVDGVDMFLEHYAYRGP